MNNAPVYLIKRSRKLPSGKSAAYWTLRWAGSDGKWQTESLGRCSELTKRDANKKRREKESKIGSGKIRRDRPKSITLAAFLTMDRQGIEGDVSASTLVEHDNAAKHAKASIGADTLLERITYAEVGKLKKYIADAGRSPATVGKTLRMMRAAFNRAKLHGLVNDNVFAGIGIPRSDGKPKRIFTRAEVRLLVTVAPTLWWQAFISLAFTSGLRRDEMLNLLWEDIDVENGTVKIQPKQPESFTDAKGRTFTSWHWSAKAKASYRTIPLPLETMTLLGRQRVKQGASPFVFIDMRRLAQLQPHINNGRLPAKFHLVNNLLRQFHAIQEAARRRLAATPLTYNGKPIVVNGTPVLYVSCDRLPKWRLGCVHDTRRTYCTWMAEHVPMNVLREWAGHASITTTSTYYLGVGDGMAERARASFAAAEAG